MHRRPGSLTLIMFGITGDLASRYVLPALATLQDKNELPPLKKIVGLSRQDWSPNALQQTLREHGIPETITTLVEPLQFDVSNSDHYRKLDELLESADNDETLMIYLALPPHLLDDWVYHIRQSQFKNICENDKKNVKVVIEKPFGTNSKNARELETQLLHTFNENSLYRLDHYLGKISVQNILQFRFSNEIFRQGWNSESIESIKVVAHEKIDVRDRGAFYDQVGALRDMGQSHLLQLLALATMPEPTTYTKHDFDATAVQSARAHILENLKIDTAHLHKAQYQGYENHDQAAPHSPTETAFSIGAVIDLPKWKDTNIILEAGKALPEKLTKVTITFRATTHCPEKNTITFQIAPHEGISMTALLRQASTNPATISHTFTHHYDETPQAYEQLLSDAVQGRHLRFTSQAEIEAAWKFIESVETAWQDIPLQYYEPHTNPFAHE